MNKSALIDKIKELEGLSNDEKSALLGLLRSHKKYGLVWEDKPEDVEERLKDSLPVLTEVKERAIISESPDAPNHILIEGDNLEALTALSYTHEGKIDVIYIDPPYNTGKKEEFKYNDHYVDAEDSYKHSKWLSFMNKRLKIAKHLLSESGVIFISIDDRESAQLKLLCDEIFGEDRFVANVCWQRTYSTRNDSKGIPSEVESILIYSKDLQWSPRKLPRTDKMNSLYKSPDNDPRVWTSSSVSAPGAATHQGMVYAIQHPFTGEYMYPTIGRCWSLGQESMLENLKQWCDYRLEDIQDAEQRAQVCGVPVTDVRANVMAIVLDIPLDEARVKAEEVLKKGNWPYFYFTNGGKGGLRRKTYLEDIGGRIVTNYFPHEECGHTDEAKKEIISIFGGKSPFETPKPTRLIERIIYIASTKDSTILDFFAGSGTTMHATMRQNLSDGGHRTCILATNNERNICEEVAYERNKRVINGYISAKGEFVEGIVDNSLRYYKTSLVQRERTMPNMRKLVSLATDMLCIKEDLYKEEFTFGKLKLNPQIARYFNDGKSQMLVIYREEVIRFFVDEIEKMSFDGKLKVYLFAPDRYAFDDDFFGVSDKVQLCALPAAIYDAYQKVLPKHKPKYVEIDEVETEDKEDSTLF